jgi:hypothetical protein
MKKIFIATVTLFVLFIFYASNNTINAADRVTPKQCFSYGGSCITALACADGSLSIKPNDCPSTQICCLVDNIRTDVSRCDDGTDGIQTAIGCIHVLGSSEEFLSDILRWAVGIGGGIAFLLILYAGFMIMTASGNPERLKAGQELLTSAISGLILLIFSVFILKFIGVDILGLGAFGFGK